MSVKHSIKRNTCRKSITQPKRNICKCLTISNHIIASINENVYVESIDEPVEDLIEFAPESIQLKTTIDASKVHPNEIIDKENVERIINLDSWDITNVKTFAGLFKGFSSLKTLEGLEKWDTKNITDISSMFEGCESLTNINFMSEWDISNVHIMNNTFKDCRLLSSIEPLKNIKYVTAINNTFENCETLITLEPLRDWNVKQIRKINETFKGCSLLVTVKDLSLWTFNDNIYSVINLFAGCSNLASLEGLENWFVNSKVHDIKGLFKDCVSLISVEALAKWKTRDSTVSEMFMNCRRLKSLKGLENLLLKVGNGISLIAGHSTSGIGVTNIPYIARTDASNMFSGCHSLEDISALASWDVLRIKIFDGFFKDCRELKTLTDLSEWRTNQTNSMSYMFSGCISLTTLEGLQKWKIHTSKMPKWMTGKKSYNNFVDNDYYTNIYVSLTHMFSGCTSLTDISQCIQFTHTSAHMFSGCTSLQVLPPHRTYDDLPISSMFSGCVSLANINALRKYTVFEKFIKVFDDKFQGITLK